MVKTLKLFRGDFYDRDYKVRSEYVFARSRAEALEMLEERKELGFYEIKVRNA